MQLLFNQLEQAIKSAQSLLFVSHRNPDPDTVGSALALGNYAKSLGKKADFFCLDEIPEAFGFLQGVENFINDPHIFEKDYDAVIFTDCSEISRCGVKNILSYKKSFWINVDHHLNKKEAIDLTIRNQESAANCELVYEFLEYVGFVFDKESATALLSGILIDTSFLSNAATTDKTIIIAGELSQKGADYKKTIKALYKNKSQKVLHIWGKAFERLKYNDKKGIATTAIFKSDIKGDRVLEEAVHGLSNFLNAVLDAKIIAVYKEFEFGIRGSFRSSGKEDVARLAQQYGGGGHRRAAGFTIKNAKLTETENEWRIDDFL